jgi:hypothetical protein
MQRWIWIAITAAVLYAALGLLGLVPWFDFVSYDTHLARGKQEMVTGHFARAERELRGAVRRATSARQRAEACFALAELYADGWRLVHWHNWPEAKESRTAFTKNMRGWQFKNAFGHFRAWQGRKRLDHGIAQLEPACRQALAASAQAYGTRTPQYLAALDRAINLLCYKELPGVPALMRERYQVLVAVKAPGDPAIVDEIRNMQYGSEKPYEVAQLPGLFAAEIARCQRDGHVAPERLGHLYQWYGAMLATVQEVNSRPQYPDALAAMRQAATCFETAIQTHPTEDGHNLLAPYLWTGVADSQGHPELIRAWTDRFIAAARVAKTPAARAMAAATLWEFAYYWGNASDYGMAPPRDQARFDRIFPLLLAHEARSRRLAELWTLRANQALARRRYREAEGYCRQAFGALNRLAGFDYASAYQACRLPARSPDFSNEMSAIYAAYVQVLEHTGRTTQAQQLYRWID